MLLMRPQVKVLTRGIRLKILDEVAGLYGNDARK